MRITTAITKATVDSAYSFFEQLPQKEPDTVNLKEAIQKLERPLREAIAKGYSYEELVDLLKQNQIKISVFTLKSYLPQGKRTKKKPTEQKAEEPVKVAKTSRKELSENSSRVAISEPPQSSNKPVSQKIVSLQRPSNTSASAPVRRTRSRNPVKP